MHRLKRRLLRKNFGANEHHSCTTSTCLFTFSVVVVDLPIDCILSFLFPAETDVLVPVLSQSTDVVVVNFVVVLKFPNNNELTLSNWIRTCYTKQELGRSDCCHPFTFDSKITRYYYIAVSRKHSLFILFWYSNHF